MFIVVLFWLVFDFFWLFLCFEGAVDIFVIRMGESENETKMFWMLRVFVFK